LQCSARDEAMLEEEGFFAKKSYFHDYEQVCQMICFKTKIPKLGKFWRALECKIFVYFMTI
jgi:hypothetical protein